MCLDIFSLRDRKLDVKSIEQFEERGDSEICLEQIEIRSIEFTELLFSYPLMFYVSSRLETRVSSVFGSKEGCK